jgi:hypothetical protein
MTARYRVPVFTVICAAGSLAAGSMQVWWAPELKLASLAAIDRKMDQRVEPFTPADGQGVTLQNAAGGRIEERRAFTCREFLALYDEHFSPGDDYQNNREGGFIAQCIPLRVLQKAQPSRESYVRAFHWTSDSLAELPVLFLPIESGTAGQAAARSAKTWKEYEPTAHIVKAEGNTLEVDVPDAWECSLVVLARGDFNGDGVEDLLVQGYRQAMGGTFREFPVFVLTRGKGETRLRLIERL